MYIAYDKKNGVEYAKLCTSKRDGQATSKDYVNLGRVLDKEKGIYRSRSRGIFTYNVADGGYGVPEESFVPPVEAQRVDERLILDFGDAYLLDSFITFSGLRPVIDAIGYGNLDSLRAMIHYYVLCSTANCHAADWWEGSYARVLFPNANLTSQRISSFLAAVGSENALRSFFGAYVPFVAGRATDSSVLIDSTGLPNAIRFPLTAVSNHNGDIEREVRLIFVVHEPTGLPIYFRFCPGNIVDVSTLLRTIAELKHSGVNTKFAILDAGYYSRENIQELYAAGVSFVTRLKENTKLYRQLVREHAQALTSKENLVSYNRRYAYIKRVDCEVVDGIMAYAYIGLDIERKHSESRKLFKKAGDLSLSDRQVFDRMTGQGIFILVSSRPIAKVKILPTYYTRQQIEQIFDIGKNYADMLPLRVHNEDTFRGHLLLTFVATVIMRLIQLKLASTPYNPVSMLVNTRNQKCKVYKNAVVPQEPVKKVSDLYKLFGVKCPVEIAIPSVPSDSVVVRKHDREL
jgi:hypothetical protein